MNLKKILLTGAFLLATNLALSQDKLYFDVYSKGEGFFSPRINGSLKIDSNEVDFSLLFGIYSVKFKKINDSTYQEIVKNSNPFNPKEELFYYSRKDSCYTFYKYSVTKGELREGKKALEKTVFDEKYGTPPEVLNALKKGLLGDSAHFIIFGIPYSIKIENSRKGKEIIYSCNPGDIVKAEPGDEIIFPYPAEVRTEKRDGKIIPLIFFTKFLNVRTGNNTSIKGELREK